MTSSPPRGHFLRFAVVGGGGAVTNLLVFFLLADVLGRDHTLAAVAAFALAVSQNYLLNHHWTFSDVTEGRRAGFRGYAWFVFVSLGGLLVNLVILNLILRFLDLPLKVPAQAAGIVAGFLFNYIGSKMLVFVRRPEGEGRQARVADTRGYQARSPADRMTDGTGTAAGSPGCATEISGENDDR